MSMPDEPSGDVVCTYTLLLFVAQSPSPGRLCTPMDCSAPGLPVPHHLSKFAQVHVHCISDAIQPSHPLTPSSPALNLSQHQRLFQWPSCLHQMTKIDTLLRHKKEWNSVISFSYTDEPRGYHSKWNKSDRKTNAIYHLYVESKIWPRWTYLQNRIRLTHGEQRCGCYGGQRKARAGSAGSAGTNW